MTGVLFLAGRGEAIDFEAAPGIHADAIQLVTAFERKRRRGAVLRVGSDVGLVERTTFFRLENSLGLNVVEFKSEVFRVVQLYVTAELHRDWYLNEQRPLGFGTDLKVLGLYSHVFPEDFGGLVLLCVDADRPQLWRVGLVNSCSRLLRVESDYLEAAPKLRRYGVVELLAFDNDGLFLFHVNGRVYFGGGLHALIARKTNAILGHFVVGDRDFAPSSYRGTDFHAVAAAHVLR